nr:hypothetical protein [uncultured Acinetobacter sp.]
MSNKDIQIVKPGQTQPTPNRFAKAAEFAKTSKDVVSGEISKETKVNWDAPVELKHEIDAFVGSSRKFKFKKEFLNQCVRDGLEKYKGQ